MSHLYLYSVSRVNLSPKDPSMS